MLESVRPLFYSGYKMCILQVTAQWFGNIEIMFSQLEKSGKPKITQLMKNIVIFFLKTVKFRTGMVNKKIYVFAGLLSQISPSRNNFRHQYFFYDLYFNEFISYIVIQLIFES